MNQGNIIIELKTEKEDRGYKSSNKKFGAG